MTAFGSLPVTIGAGSGGNPAAVIPKGWALGGAGVVWTQNPQTFAATITPDLALGNWITITATSNIAFALQTPIYNGVAISATNVPLGMPILLTLLNNSGGALGAFSQAGIWKGSAGGFASPGNGLQICSFNMVLSATQIIGVTNWSTASAF